jgi:glucan phosphoethanolaminetransferase (alkaline phosphatase superfamily)
MKLKFQQLIYLIKKYPWIIVSNIYLILPLLISLNTENLLDPVTAWNIVTSISFLVLVHSLFKRPFYCYLLISPLFVTVLADLFITMIFKDRLTTAYISIAIAEIAEWRELLSTFPIEITIGLLTFIIYFAVTLFKVKNYKFTHSRKWSLVFFLIFGIIYFAVPVRQMKVYGYNFEQAFLDTMEHDFGSPHGIIPQSYSMYRIFKLQEENILKKKDFYFTNIKKEIIGESEVYIYIIGESARRQSWQLFGYNRKNNPNLATKDNLILFNDVISPWPFTQKSVLSMFTRADSFDFSKASKEKSFLSIFKGLGFKTYWFSTQPLDQFAGMIYQLANETNSIRYFTRKYDSALIEPVKKLLHKLNKEKDKVFIVLHTKGSHFEYTNRYPKQFEKYPINMKLTKKQRTINAYDNSILYTDKFINDIIDLLKEENIISSIFYISDHGENLYDDENNFFGHGYGTKYDTAIPMIFWYSNKFEQKFNPILSNLKINKDKKISIKNVFHSITDMAGITFDEQQRELSFFSKSFTESKRYIFHASKNKHELIKE